jgi:soluble lytic murein transglycosylase-like protein
LKKQNEELLKEYEALKISKAAEKAELARVRREAIAWKPLIAKYFPSDQVNNAIKIVNAESGGNTNVLSPTRDRGLFQINAIHIGRVNGNLEALFDPETNVKVAYAIWSEQGWGPWTTKGVLS